MLLLLLLLNAFAQLLLRLSLTNGTPIATNVSDDDDDDAAAGRCVAATDSVRGLVMTSLDEMLLLVASPTPVPNGGDSDDEGVDANAFTLLLLLNCRLPRRNIGGDTALLLVAVNDDDCCDDDAL